MYSVSSHQNINSTRAGTASVLFSAVLSSTFLVHNRYSVMLSEAVSERSDLSQCGEKGTLLHCWWECKLVQPLWETVWRFLRKLKIELPYDSAIPLLGIYPDKTIIQKDTCTAIFIAALFTIAKTWKQHKCPLTDEWIKTMCCIYTMEYNSAIKRRK